MLQAKDWASTDDAPSLTTFEEVMKQVDEITQASDGDTADLMLMKVTYQVSQIRDVVAAFSKATADRNRYKKSELRTMTLLAARQLEVSAFSCVNLACLKESCLLARILQETQKKMIARLLFTCQVWRNTCFPDPVFCFIVCFAEEKTSCSAGGPQAGTGVTQKKWARTGPVAARSAIRVARWHPASRRRREMCLFLLLSFSR